MSPNFNCCSVWTRSCFRVSSRNSRLHFADRHIIDLFELLFRTGLLNTLGDQRIELGSNIFFADIDERVLGRACEHEFLVDHFIKQLIFESGCRGIHMTVERVKLRLRVEVGLQHAFFTDNGNDAVKRDALRIEKRRDAVTQARETRRILWVMLFIFTSDSGI